MVYWTQGFYVANTNDVGSPWVRAPPVDRNGLLQLSLDGEDSLCKPYNIPGRGTHVADTNDVGKSLGLELLQSTGTISCSFRCIGEVPSTIIY